METIIQVRGLTKAYGQLPAVDHVSLSVKAVLCSACWGQTDLEKAQRSSAF